jgi:hypothetical protein
VVASKQPVEKGRPGATHMKVTGGRGGETDADQGIHTSVQKSKSAALGASKNGAFWVQGRFCDWGRLVADKI